VLNFALVLRPLGVGEPVAPVLYIALASDPWHRLIVRWAGSPGAIWPDRSSGIWNADCVSPPGPAAPLELWTSGRLCRWDQSRGTPCRPTWFHWHFGCACHPELRHCPHLALTQELAHPAAAGCSSFTGHAGRLRRRSGGRRSGHPNTPQSTRRGVIDHRVSCGKRSAGRGLFQ